ncbi:hypothetical protein L195_g033478 [Trifolium pratense]|uniref:Uncharacterized protein n=1 Tax=Trifolium pratense TaxID=57577 RepID=A0A2K3LG53_TRIPR|nr:hypothetical protein L195_g033478 [Trifolium pratense]
MKTPCSKSGNGGDLLSESRTTVARTAILCKETILPYEKGCFVSPYLPTTGDRSFRGFMATSTTHTNAFEMQTDHQTQLSMFRIAVVVHIMS